MVLSKKDVEHIAHLSRLGLSEEEKEKFSRQLGRILEYAEILKKLPTENITPTSHAIPMETLFREDEPCPFSDTEAILKNAPDRNDNFFAVPRILEAEE